MPSPLALAAVAPPALVVPPLPDAPPMSPLPPAFDAPPTLVTPAVFLDPCPPAALVDEVLPPVASPPVETPPLGALLAVLGPPALGVLPAFAPPTDEVPPLAILPPPVLPTWFPPPVELAEAPPATCTDEPLLLLHATQPVATTSKIQTEEPVRSEWRMLCSLDRSEIS